MTVNDAEDQNEGKPDKEGILQVYQQYWEQARHSENERLLFAGTYAAIVAAAVAYMSQAGGLKWPLLLFLAMFSLLGLLITNAWNLPFVRFTRLAELIAIAEWKLPKAYCRYSSYGEGKSLQILGFSLFTSAGDVFALFYISGIAGFLALFIRKAAALGSPWSDIVLLSAAPIWVAVYVWHRRVLRPPIAAIHSRFLVDVDAIRRVSKS